MSTIRLWHMGVGIMTLASAFLPACASSEDRLPKFLGDGVSRLPSTRRGPGTLAAMDVEIEFPVSAWTATAADLRAVHGRSQRSEGDRGAEQHDAHRRADGRGVLLVARFQQHFRAVRGAAGNRKGARRDGFGGQRGDVRSDKRDYTSVSSLCAQTNDRHIYVKG